MSRKTISIVFLLLLMACSTEKKAGDDNTNSKLDIPSPRMEARGEANGVTIAIDYGSPAVKGRKVWGGLEKYGRVWRAGANETTSISFDKNALIGGSSIEAGKYALFIIPKEEGNWVVVFNRDWDEWGAFSYDQAKDVLRVEVTPEWDENIQERLEYSVKEGNLIFAWEKVRLKMGIEADE